MTHRMRLGRTLRVLLLPPLLLAACLLPALQGTSQAALRVLMLSAGGKTGDGEHDWEKNFPHLEKVLKGTGAEVTRLVPPPDQPTSLEHLKSLAQLKPGQYDVIVAYAGINPPNAEVDAAVTGFVEAGGGLTALHRTSGSGRNSPAWMRLVGARFAGHAPGTFELGIRVTRPDHPILRGVKDFTITDEEYCHNFAPDVQREVLAVFQQRPPNTTEKAGNNDVAWTLRHGRGRVAYTCLGHGEAAWKHPSFLRLAAQAAYWAAGRPREVAVP